MTHGTDLARADLQVTVRNPKGRVGWRARVNGTTCGKTQMFL